MVSALIGLTRPGLPSPHQRRDLVLVKAVDQHGHRDAELLCWGQRGAVIEVGFVFHAAIA